MALSGVKRPRPCRRVAVHHAPSPHAPSRRGISVFLDVSGHLEVCSSHLDSAVDSSRRGLISPPAEHFGALGWPTSHSSRCNLARAKAGAPGRTRTFDPRLRRLGLPYSRMVCGHRECPKHQWIRVSIEDRCPRRTCRLPPSSHSAAPLMHGRGNRPGVRDVCRIQREQVTAARHQTGAIRGSHPRKIRLPAVRTATAAEAVATHLWVVGRYQSLTYKCRNLNALRGAVWSPRD